MGSSCRRLSHRPSMRPPSAGAGEEMVDALVALHAVDIETAGLTSFGRPDGFVGRAIGRAVKTMDKVRTRDLPRFDTVGRWLQDNLPEPQGATVVHGDYRLGNVMFAAEAPARLVAIFDWEIAGLGDPLVDLGYLSAFWVQPDDPPLKMYDLAKANRLGGFGSREDLVRRYRDATGLNVEGIRYYEVLALWRLAPMMQGMFQRAASGSVDNAYLRAFETGVVELTERSAELAGVA